MPFTKPAASNVSLAAAFWAALSAAVPPAPWCTMVHEQRTASTGSRAIGTKGRFRVRGENLMIHSMGAAAAPGARGWPGGRGSRSSCYLARTKLLSFLAFLMVIRTQSVSCFSGLPVDLVLMYLLACATANSAL